MADTAEAFLKANDNANDYADKLIDDLHQKSLEDIDQLFNELDAREPEVWEKFDAPIDSTVDDFEDVETEDRDIDWVIGLAAISAAAATQFFLQNREETLIKPLAYREQVVGSLDVPREELIRAAKRSVTVESPLSFVEIRTKYLDDLSFLRTIPDDVLYETLIDYGAMRAPEKTLADAIAYVTRMTEYEPGSPQFTEAVNALIDQNSTRALKGMNRRAVERTYTYRQTNGKMDTLLVWVVEKTPRTCEYCAELAGTVATYGQFIERGQLPGASVCKGGDYCNCRLEAI